MVRAPILGDACRVDVGEGEWLAAPVPCFDGDFVGCVLHFREIGSVEVDADARVSGVTVVWGLGDFFFSFICSFGRVFVCCAYVRLCWSCWCYGCDVSWGRRTGGAVSCWGALMVVG